MERNRENPGSGEAGEFIWRRTADGQMMRFWQSKPTCCQAHNLSLMQKRGTETYHKCYVCGRSWVEPVPTNPMEAVKIKPLPTKWENGMKKKPLIPEGSIIVHL